MFQIWCRCRAPSPSPSARRTPRAPPPCVTEWPKVVQWIVQNYNDWWFSFRVVAYVLVLVSIGLFMFPALFFAVQVP